MSVTMSAATSLPPAYYQDFVSQSRTIAAHSSNPPVAEPSEEEKLLAQARQQTYDLQDLEEGWNGYDALPPSGQSIRQAMHWLIRSYAECKDASVRWYKPNVTASAEGEVVFEWRASDCSLVVYVEGDAVTFHKSRDLAGKTEHQHGDAPLGADQANLLRWFGK